MSEIVERILRANHAGYNREYWDADSDAYQAAHGEAINSPALAWGHYRIPESELQILGDVTGRDLLELGCGAAQWSIALIPLGARVVAFDISGRQLAHARQRDMHVQLVQGNGEQLPFAGDSFDVVFCDAGAMDFCEPNVIIAEVARVLRSGGMLAFSTTHPLLYLTFDSEYGKYGRQTRKLQMDYAELGPMFYGTGTIDWVLPPGKWIALLRGGGFIVERLEELIPPVELTTTREDFAPSKWAHRWPAQWIWVARRE